MGDIIPDERMSKQTAVDMLRKMIFNDDKCSFYVANGNCTGCPAFHDPYCLLRVALREEE